MALVSALLRVLGFQRPLVPAKRKITTKPTPTVRGQREELEDSGVAVPSASPSWSSTEQRDAVVLDSSQPAQETGPTFEIVYRDPYGAVAERRIHVKRLFRVGDRIFLVARCALRQRERTFRADRIQRLVTEAGRAIASPVQFFDRMAPETIAEPQSHKRTMTKVKPGLQALLWIARTDHEIDEAEEAILLSYIDQRVAIGRGKLDHSWERSLALSWIYDAAPTRGECLSAVGRMSGGSPEAALLKDHAERIVASSGAFDEQKENRRRQLMKAVT